MTQKLFSELGLSEVLLKAIDQLGYENAAPIQAETIPLILACHDIIGQSQTGSGKTAALAIPSVEMIDPRTHRGPVLLLSPTRERAMQAALVIYKLSAF